MSIFDESLMVTFSTAHITENDKNLLESGNQNCVSCDKFEYGYYIPISEDVIKEEIVAAGFSEQFADVYITCRSEKAGLLRLDCDGATYPEFEQFKW